MVLSKSIIGSHYSNQLLFDYFDFTLLKNVLHGDKVSIRNFFVPHVLQRSQLALPMMHRQIKETIPVMHRQIKETSFYYLEERLVVAGTNVCKKSIFQLIKNFSQILILCENKLLKAVFYKSTSVKKVIECRQRYWTSPFRSSFVLRLNQVVLLQDIFAFAQFASTHFLNLQ